MGKLSCVLNNYKHGDSKVVGDVENSYQKVLFINNHWRSYSLHPTVLLNA